MPRKSDEDLFRESTMSFGEHLEELRRCLFYALFWLIGGFLAGLLVANYVVAFIQSPLETALEAHYKAAAERMLRRMEAKGLPLPGSVEQLVDLVAEENLLPEEVYVQPSELLGQILKDYQRAGQEREAALQELQQAAPLVARLGLPADDPKKELSGKERVQVSQAIGLIGPAASPADGDASLDQHELDRLRHAVEHARDISADDLARLAAALKRQEERFRQDLERIARATRLLADTQLPSAEPQFTLKRGDLARIFLWSPVENDPRIKARAFGVSEGFMIWMKAALLVGVLLAAPGIFYHLWSFVASGLYYHERRFVYTFGPMSVVLFFAGASLVFLFVFQLVLRFLFTFNEWLGIGIEPRITEWLGFVLILPLGFGVAFQLPLVMLFLERIGIFSVQAYVSKWRIAVLVIFVISMVLTPADPGSMMLMAAPLTFLYFGGILLCCLMPRSRSPYQEEQQESQSR